MIILALDCATKTGWALVENGEIIESGVQDFTKRRGESNGIVFLRFRRWLQDILSLWKPTVVVYERAHHRGGAATEMCVGLTTRVEERCAESDIEHSAVHTAELKRFATGKGGAKKEQMVQAAATVLGRPPIDDNEADAVLMAKWGWREFGMPIRTLQDRSQGTITEVGTSLTLRKERWNPGEHSVHFRPYKKKC